MVEKELEYEKGARMPTPSQNPAEESIGVVWLVHGARLIRCTPRQLRACTDEVVAIGMLNGTIAEEMPSGPKGLAEWLDRGEVVDNIREEAPTLEDFQNGALTCLRGQ